MGTRKGERRLPRRLTRRPGRALRLAVLALLNLLWLAFFLFPFYVQTVTALKSPADAEAGSVLALPRHPSLRNIEAVLSSAVYMHAMLNSTVVATVTTALVLALGMAAAFALAMLPLPRKRLILTVVVVIVAFPPLALVPSLYLLFLHLHLTDTYVALIASDAGLVLPFAIWVLTTTFCDIPPVLVDQAEVDGCTPVQTLRRVVLPLAAPGLAACGVLCFIMVWNEFLFGLTLTFSIKAEPMTVVIGGYGGLWAASEVVTLPIIVLALLGQRGIVRGLTAGAVNG